MWHPTCLCDHVVPADDIGVAIVELAMAVDWQLGVCIFQNMPHVYAQRADLVLAFKTFVVLQPDLHIAQQEYVY